MTSAFLDVPLQAIHLDCPADKLSQVFEVAAPSLAAQADVEPLAIQRALIEASSESDFMLGSAIALPHVAMPGLAKRAISIVRTERPIQVGDGTASTADVFFVIAYPIGAPSAHLHFLAHLATVCRSRAFRDGLRSAESAEQVLDLIRAAETRVGLGTSTSVAPSGAQVMAIIGVTGERATDAIMLGLINEQLSSASIVDVQNIRDAASREVPLFAGFRDLFGDPGGRRLIFAEISAEHAETVAAIVRQACEEDPTAAADLIVVPITARWSWAPAARTKTSSGH